MDTGTEYYKVEKRNNVSLRIIIVLGLLLVTSLSVVLYLLAYPDHKVVSNKFTFDHANFMHDSLDRTIKILESGQVKYSLFAGSLLAWRRTMNNGPFVWDDDLDLVVPKTDWYKFTDLLEKKADEFGLEFQWFFFGCQLRSKYPCGTNVIKSFVVDIFVIEWVDGQARKVDFGGGMPQAWKDIRYSPKLTIDHIFPKCPRRDNFWGLQACVPSDDEAVDTFLRDHYGPSCLTHARIYNHNGVNEHNDICLKACPGLNIGMPVPT